MNTPVNNRNRPELAAQLENMLRRMPGAVHAAVATADGLITAHTAGLDTTAAEQLSAIVTGIHALSHSANKVMGAQAGEVVLSMIQMNNAQMFIGPAGDGARLLVCTDITASNGDVAYEMAKMKDLFAAHFTVDARGHDSPPAAPEHA
jgi:predicted regulator of Ras-like GTPase activity (Roadblock/LC7/MglB family)